MNDEKRDLEGKEEYKDLEDMTLQELEEYAEKVRRMYYENEGTIDSLRYKQTKRQLDVMKIEEESTAKHGLLEEITVKEIKMIRQEEIISTLNSRIKELQEIIEADQRKSQKDAEIGE